MQVLKKITLFFLVLGLLGCNNRLTDNRIDVSDQKYDIIDYDTVNQSMRVENALNIGVLLPLSGKAANIGQGMQNAMFMALDDLKNNKLVLKFYDTKSTEIGAAEAARKAISEGAELILGPLMGEEVSSITSLALSSNIPVVSFTTSPQVLQKGIYSVGLLNSEQVERSIAYGASKGRSKLVMLVPNNNSGLNIVKAGLASAKLHGVDFKKVGFYNPNTMDFTGIVRDVSSGKDFDMVLVADTGNRLKSIVSMFAYNDVMYPNVMFLGTAAWDSTNLSKETILYHGVYPMVSKGYGNSYFANKYHETFGEQPKPVYSFAYDSVLLASVLSSKNKNELDAGITGKAGFIGVNGYFKILPTGQSRHSLEMLEVTRDGPIMISPADKRLVDRDTEETDVRYITYEQLPRFYGKNSSEVLNWLNNN